LNDQMATSFNGPSPTLKALNNKLFVDRIIQWILRPVYTCNFCCDFLLLMDANEWMSFECSDEGTHLLVHIHQKQIKIALEIETKFVSVNHWTGVNTDGVFYGMTEWRNWRNWRNGGINWMAELTEWPNWRNGISAFVVYFCGNFQTRSMRINMILLVEKFTWQLSKLLRFYHDILSMVPHRALCRLQKLHPFSKLRDQAR
jgi:hypothetical protein